MATRDNSDLAKATQHLVAEPSALSKALAFPHTLLQTPAEAVSVPPFLSTAVKLVHKLNARILQAAHRGPACTGGGSLYA